jgi:hypothetical protein
MRPHSCEKIRGAESESTAPERCFGIFLAIPNTAKVRISRRRWSALNGRGSRRRLPDPLAWPWAHVDRYRRRALVADLAKQDTAPLDIAKRMDARVDFVMKIIRHGPERAGPFPGPVFLQIPGRHPTSQCHWPRRPCWRWATRYPSFDLIAINRSAVLPVGYEGVLPAGTVARDRRSQGITKSPR